MDPVDINIYGIQGVYILWGLTAISMFFFLRRIVKIVGILKKARPENRFDNIKQHIVNFILYVLGQKKLFGERTIGLPHFLFFWGFVFYAGSFWWNLIRGLIPVLPIPYADEVGIVALSLEITGVLVILSIIVAVLRRIFFPPAHLQQSFDAVIILSLISILMITLLLGQGYKATVETSVWSPIGSIIASGLTGISEGTAIGAFKAFWWVHIITVLFFLAYIPYSKHMHLLASPFNVLFSNNSQPADLTIVSKSEDVTTGASKWNEFTWKDLLNSFSCAECGRCDRVCPALNSGAILAPRVILHKIKEQMYETGFKSTGNGIPELFEEKISKDELWQCTTCMSCMQQCPVLNEHIPVIVSMRRFLINQGDVEQTVQDVLQKVTRYGNSFGQSDRNRAKWTTTLEPKIKDARKEEVEYLWFTGDYAAFDTRLQGITQKTAMIFQKAGLDFGILYEAEKNSGNDVRRIGEEGLFEILKEKNIQSMQKSKFKKIITTDPHTYNTLKNEYKLNTNGNGNGISVHHYTEVIDELIKSNKISINNKLNIRATYHDPCYLGRYNGVYEPPRKILKSIGIDLIEMPRNKEKSYCCGAGGGRIWMEDKTPVKERPSESRIREAVALKNVSALVVACPKDIVMFLDAVKTTGNEGKIEVKDISELVFDSMQE
ncbi:MAG: heterodisulfide reductase-related iron-sulfur binding cluster [Bacteroidetes bacterium]|nr:heterodisulfide reductase-related iron-sulfur binding cluster [Bacteroidota bacterium]